VSSPEKDVLGYFYAASESSRRYFYHDIKGITLDFNDGCVEEDLGVGGFRAMTGGNIQFIIIILPGW